MPLRPGPPRPLRLTPLVEPLPLGPLRPTPLLLALTRPLRLTPLVEPLRLALTRPPRPLRLRRAAGRRRR
ncbi:hypothetical protein [Dactylosporangium sp. NPDC050588]|uniref:hypothetical protein n=1 Tax=Dactylosporangium sp. NPDC050588 TaxID=3157211 RepID=UPI0033DB6E44